MFSYHNICPSGGAGHTHRIRNPERKEPEPDAMKETQNQRKTLHLRMSCPASRTDEAYRGLRNTTDKGTQHGFFEDCRAERGLPRFIRSAFLTCPAAGLWRATPTTQYGRMKPIPDERAYFSYAGASGTDARTTERGLRTAPIAGYTMCSFGKTRCG